MLLASSLKSRLQRTTSIQTACPEAVPMLHALIGRSYKAELVEAVAPPGKHHPGP